MTKFQKSFYAISVVVVITILITCCSTGPIHVIYGSDINSYMVEGFRPQRTNLNEPCESSVNYDHLSVIPDYTRPITTNTEWVCNLYRKVKQLKERQVTMLVCNKDYLHVLINWLAHAVLYAFYPANSILIIAFDSFTHSVLENKGFHSVYILPEAVANAKTKDSVAHVWITRITVARLLNYWNYSVLEFDSDAIMISNIQPILNNFSNSDIIASGGTFPFDLYKKWKTPTICMGVILFKCSPATG